MVLYLLGQLHPFPPRIGAGDQPPFLMTFMVHRSAYPMVGVNRTHPTISLANFPCVACSPAGLLVLSMLN